MSRVGDDLVEAFEELTAHLRGEVEVEAYELPADFLTPERIRTIRKSVSASTTAFEREFRIPARTIESYEQGRRKPDSATRLLLRLIEQDPETVRKVASVSR